MMKKPYQCLLMILFGMLVFAGPSFAEDMYVASVTEISLRTGPSVDNKIIAMLKTGNKLEIIEFNKDWSQVRTDNGKSGWVLSRFITPKKPEILLLDELKEKNQNLLSKIAQLEEENKSLAAKKASLVELEEKFNKTRLRRPSSKSWKPMWTVNPNSGFSSVPVFLSWACFLG